MKSSRTAIQYISFFIIYLISVIGNVSHAQRITSKHVLHASDSLFNICEKNILTDANSVVELASQILVIGTAQNNIASMARSNYYVGKGYRQLGRYKESLQHLNTGTRLFHELADKRYECLCIKEIGIVYFLLNENDKSMEYYTRAMALAKEANLVPETISLTNNIGNLFDWQKHYDKAIAYYEEGLSMKPKDDVRATLLTNLGKAYSGKGMYEKSLHYYQQSVELCNRVNDPTCLVRALNGIASVYWEQELDDQALEVSFSILALQERADLKTDRVETLNRIGISYMNLKNSTKAIAHLRKALSLAREIDYPRTHFIHANLAFAYEQAGQFKAAYLHFFRHKQMQDSITDLNNSKQLEELLAKYEADKKEQKITLLQQEKQLQDLKLQAQVAELDRQSLIRNTIIIVAFLLLVPALILLIFYRQKMRSKMLLSAKIEEVNRQATLELIREHEIKTIKANLEGREKERERIAHELHDGVAGSLAGIKLHLVKVAEMNNQQGSLEKAIRNIDNIYEEVRTISHNLSPLRVLNKAFIDLIRNQLNQFAENSSIELEFICFPEDELNQLPDIIKIEVYRIIQELMTNIIKHAEAKSVEVQFTKNEEDINLIVEDRGKGFDTTKGVYGLGLNSIRTRVNNIRGRLHIDSTRGRGTIVNIDIPIRVGSLQSIN